MVAGGEEESLRCETAVVKSCCVPAEELIGGLGHDASPPVERCPSGTYMS